MLYAAIVYFILVHAPGGEEIEVNVREIASLRKPRSQGSLVAPGGCVIHMNNGKFQTVTETCLQVIEKIAALSEQRREH